MKKIESISTERMSNGAHFLFMSDVLAKAQTDEKISKRIKELLSTFKTAVQVEDESMQSSRKSLMTDDIEVADQKRDSLYRGYKKAINAFKDFPVPEQAQAAKILLQHIKDYNIDPEAQMDKETGLLINFIQDLEDKYKPQIDILGLGTFVDQLKTMNEKLHTLTSNRTDERISIVTGALKKARATTDSAYRECINMINAIALVEGDTDYTPFIDYMNTEITHYKQEVLGNKSQKSTTETKPSTEKDTNQE